MLFESMHMCVCVCNPENNVLYRLSPKWLVATNALGQIMHGYTLLVPVNERVLNKPNKERNISDHK